MFQMVSCVPQDEMAVVAGHVGSRNIGYNVSE